MCCECKNKYAGEPDLSEAPLLVLLFMAVVCGSAGLFFIGMLIELIAASIFHV